MEQTPCEEILNTDVLKPRISIESDNFPNSPHHRWTEELLILIKKIVTPSNPQITSTKELSRISS
jgi:hypothetical protein